MTNCYRCGFDFDGEQCLFCGKFAPDESDPVGRAADELRIAVVLPEHWEIDDTRLKRFSEQALAYRRTHTWDAEQKQVFVYSPRQSAGLFELLQSTADECEREILFNGRRRPYEAELWLPLLWFLT